MVVLVIKNKVVTSYIPCVKFEVHYGKKYNLRVYNGQRWSDVSGEIMEVLC